MNREELDIALVDVPTWQPRLRTEAMEAFAIHMQPKRCDKWQTRDAWQWFHEGYQCGVVFERMRRLRSSAEHGEL